MSMFTVYSNIGLMFCGLGLDQTLVRYFYHRDDLDYKRTILFECLSAPTILCVVLGLLILPAALFTNTMGWTSQPISELALLEINVFVLVVHRYAILLLRLRYHPESNLSYHCSCSGRVVEGLLLLHPCGLNDPKYLDRNGMRCAVGKGSVGLPRSIPGKLDPAKGTAFL